MKKTFLASILAFSMFLTLGTILVYAQAPIDGIQVPGGGNPGGGNPGSPSIKVSLVNPFNCRGVEPCTIFVLLEVVIDKILLPIGGILAVLAFIYTGFLYVTAQGNTGKLETAHKALLYTSVGAALLLGSWVIAKVIENTVKQLR